MNHSQTYSQYDKFMGRWSREVATQFIKWIGPEPHLSWLDVGCGTGTLAQAVIKNCSPSLIVGTDPLKSSIEAASYTPKTKMLSSKLVMYKIYRLTRRNSISLYLV